MKILDIYLHEKKIGQIHSFPGKINYFLFEKDYLQDPKSATLSLSFKDKITSMMASKKIPQLRPIQIKLPSFFSNLLPEAEMREYLAKRVHLRPENEFDLLAALGLDLPGAIRAISHEDHNPQSTAKEITKRKMNRNLYSSENSLHFSLAGIQLKFSALFNTQKQMTIGASGIGGNWIIKLPSFRFPYMPENELAMMLLAKKVGINVPKVSLITIDSINNLPPIAKFSNEKNAFIINRFDRSINGPIHMEDFAQVFGLYPKDKYSKINYKNIAEVLWTQIGSHAVEEFIKRLVFNMLIGNADMHAKNWSLIYPDKIHPELAPAYDFISTICYLPDDKMALNLVKEKRWDQINMNSFISFANKIKFPVNVILNTIQQTVELFHQCWEEEKKNINLPKEFIRIIDNHQKSIDLK